VKTAVTDGCYYESISLEWQNRLPRHSMALRTVFLIGSPDSEAVPYLKQRRTWFEHAGFPPTPETTPPNNRTSARLSDRDRIRTFRGKKLARPAQAHDPLSGGDAVRGRANHQASGGKSAPDDGADGTVGQIHRVKLAVPRFWKSPAEAVENSRLTSSDRFIALARRCPGVIRRSTLMYRCRSGWALRSIKTIVGDALTGPGYFDTFNVIPSCSHCCTTRCRSAMVPFSSLVVSTRP